MEPVRRDEDDELCGYVESTERGWSSLTVFGGLLGEHADRAGAVERVLLDGLAALSERWQLRDTATDDEQPVCVLEATPTRVVLALDEIVYPGVPTTTLQTAELRAGRWILRRRTPGDPARD